MRRFMLTENIRHFRELLAAPLDDARRHTIETLLAEEEAALERLIQDRDEPERPGHPPP